MSFDTVYSVISLALQVGDQVDSEFFDAFVDSSFFSGVTVLPCNLGQRYEGFKTIVDERHVTALSPLELSGSGG